MLTVGQEGLGPPSDGPIAGGTCSNGFPDFRVDIGLCLVCLQLILEALFWVSSCLLAAGLFSKQNYRWELRGDAFWTRDQTNGGDVKIMYADNKIC